MLGPSTWRLPRRFRARLTEFLGEYCQTQDQILDGAKNERGGGGIAGMCSFAKGWTSFTMIESPLIETHGFILVFHALSYL